MDEKDVDTPIRHRHDILLNTVSINPNLPVEQNVSSHPMSFSRQRAAAHTKNIPQQQQHQSRVAAPPLLRPSSCDYVPLHHALQSIAPTSMPLRHANFQGYPTPNNSRRHELLPSQDVLLRLSLLLNALLAIALFLVASPRWGAVEEIEIEKQRDAALAQAAAQEPLLSSQHLIFHGGHPVSEQTGTCYCGDSDHYCLCTPSVGIDLVITDATNSHMWVVRRKDTNLLATMGGFANVGESLEQAVRRELTEETGIMLSQVPHKLRLFGVYSDPRRDNRRHSASAVYVVEVPDDIQPNAADDVKSVEKIRMEDIEQYDFYADHKTILMDFRRSVQPGEKVTAPLNDGDFADDIMRSTCP